MAIDQRIISHNDAIVLLMTIYFAHEGHEHAHNESGNIAYYVIGGTLILGAMIAVVYFVKKSSKKSPPKK